MSGSDPEVHAAPRADGGPGARLARGLALGVALGLVVLAALALWSDARGMGAALARFPLSIAAAACALSCANYLLRFVRWQFYLRRLGLSIPAGTSFLISLAGLLFTVSPGKLGEAWKSWLVRRVTGAPLAQTAPIVLAERFTDLLAFLALFALGGLGASIGHAWVFAVVLLGCGALLAFVGAPRAQAWALARAARFPLLARLVPSAHAALTSTRALLAPRTLLVPTLLATAGWFLECVGFWLVADAFAPGSVDLPFATAVFAFAALAGALLVLFPGGLGPTEASLTALLAPRYAAAGLAAEAARASAASATLVIRLCTLWFAVALGALAALAFERHARRR